MASMIPLNGAMKLKSSSELPPHVTREQYLEMVETAKQKHDWDARARRNYVHLVRGRRDPLLLRMMWETGGRVSDIANLCLSDFDFSRRLLRLRVKKTGRVNEIPLEEGTLLDVSSYMPGHFAEHPKEPLFGINRWQIWNIVREYGKDIGIDAHPHMFRHGLAIYLLNNNVPIPIISARLGHSSVLTTMRYYLVITPEIQRQFMQNVKL